MAKKKKNPLLGLIDENKNLSRDQKILFRNLSNLFYDEVEYINNLNRTAPELAEVYGVGIEDWRAFIEYPTVAKFIDDEADAYIRRKARASLMNGDLKTNEAIKIDKDIRSREKGLDNSNIVVMLLPQKRSE